MSDAMLAWQVTLRFARVKGYRPDKRAKGADTIDVVRAIHERGPREADAGSVSGGSA